MLAQESRGRPIVVQQQDALVTHGTTAEALSSLMRYLEEIVTRVRPERAYIEVPGAMNAERGRSLKTVIALAEARGVALVALNDAAVPLREIDQADVKQALTGQRTAQKRQVEGALLLWAQAGDLVGFQRLYKRGSTNPDYDQSDAVALGVVGLQLDWRKLGEGR